MEDATAQCKHKAAEEEDLIRTFTTEPLSFYQTQRPAYVFHTFHLHVLVLFPVRSSVLRVLTMLKSHDA